MSQQDQTRNTYGMTEDEWQNHLKEDAERIRQFEETERQYYREQEYKERNQPPTLDSLKHIRPDLYW